MESGRFFGWLAQPTQTWCRWQKRPTCQRNMISFTYQFLNIYATVEVKWQTKTKLQHIWPNCVGLWVVSGDIAVSFTLLPLFLEKETSPTHEFWPFSALRTRVRSKKKNLDVFTRIVLQYSSSTQMYTNTLLHTTTLHYCTLLQHNKLLHYDTLPHTTIHTIHC